jgi:GntR family transcriptional regulator
VSTRCAWSRYVLKEVTVAGGIGPSYQLVADDIRTRIRSGEYEIGQPIPSTAKLMEMHQVSSTVVRRAVEQLRADGILVGHSGKGVYVQAMPDDVPDRAGGHAAAQEMASLTESVGRVEANLIELYGKLGYDYPHDGTAAPARKPSANSRTARRERRA